MTRLLVLPKHDYVSRKHCKDCYNQYNREWAANNRDTARAYERKNRAKRRKFIDDYKVKQGCADCGYNELPYVLGFDHVRGEKLFTIGTKISSMSLKALLKEIEKCDVVCHNHHAIRTYNRNQQGRIYDYDEFEEEF